MASSPPPFQVEDQTDEDFFDKLVDDDFSVEGSRSESSKMVRAFSNLSIGDVGLSLEDSSVPGFTVGEENQQEESVFPSSETPGEEALDKERSISLVSSDSFGFSGGSESSALEEKFEAVGSSPSDEAVASGADERKKAGVGSKGTSVREVQWSSFSASPQQFDSGDGFGSYSDFLTEKLDGPADKANLGADLKYSFVEHPVANLNICASSSQQQNAQFYCPEATNVNDAQFCGSAFEQTTDAQFYGIANEKNTEVNEAQFHCLKKEQNTDVSDAQLYVSATEQTTDLNDAQFYGLASEHTTDVTDAQFFGSANEQTTDVNDSQYWENLYPGWKFDSSTGQWYQTDGYDTTNNVENANEQEGYQDKDQAAGDGLVMQQSSEISYLQQTAKTVVGTITEDCTTGLVSNCNQVSQGSSEYPPNMVFDPQYPEWYYDTNTQQWYTLESFHQTARETVDTVQRSQVNASDGFLSKENSSIYNEVGHFEKNAIQGQGNQDIGRNWDGSASKNFQQNTWQHEPADKIVTSFYGNQQRGDSYGSVVHAVNHTDQHLGFKASEPIQHIGYNSNKSVTGFQSFTAESMYKFSQPNVEQSPQAHLTHSYYAKQNSIKYSPQEFQGTNASHSQFSYAFNEGRSSAGRPPHALVTFGFGGKLIVMKNSCSFGTDYGSQDAVNGAVSVLSLMEVLTDKADVSMNRSGDNGYFHALCQQPFPGPLVGGNAAAKDVNKWIDEQITHCESSTMNVREGELLRLLLSLLKISCQNYGKLRSPSGAAPSLEEADGPESAVTKLFASARTNSIHPREYSSFTHCLQNQPSEGQILTAAVEMQNLLVSGRRKEALQCAQAGQLWGPALVLAAQLGEKFYVDTVKQMACCQFLSGSPLRTLCLLIAGQPADVFSTDSSVNSNISGAVNASQKPAKISANGMLDEWEENLAIITANRTKDDELVIIHLGDCLWKERGEITAAHACYLVAEANFESYSDSARLCLIGADHWNCPRTYANPEAIQRTEIYEYSKALGNSQFVLLQFQPYKLVYAYMLAEVGKVSDSLRYCQASLKLLKSSGRTPEVEVWKLLLSSLEERLRTHQQGGYGTDLAPAKLVGKLFTSIDRSIHRMMGAPPAPLPPLPQNSLNGKESYPVAPKVTNSQSTMAMSSLITSPSVEGISEWTGDSARKSMYSRSISEPDFGRSPKQDSLKDASSADAQSKVSPSRFGRIGSQLFQKTIGWVSKSRTDRQAKLGESNKFYYDEKLKRWVEEGAEPPPEEAALPPPPTAASFQNGTPDNSINSAFKSNSLAASGPETKSPNPSEQSSGIPPISPSPNQFSARGRTGVRSRYVDTFNRGGGGGALASSFQSPSTLSVNPAAGVKFFVPAKPANSNEQTSDAGGSIHEAAANGELSTSTVSEASFSSPPPLMSSSLAMQRFPSMDNISPFGDNRTLAALPNGSNGSFSSHSRAASWSGSGSFGNVSNHKMTEVKPLGIGAPSSFMPVNPSSLHPSSSMVPLNGGSLGDDLHEVEL